MGVYLAQGLANASNTFLNSYNQTKKEIEAKKERDEEKAWRDEQRNQQRAEWAANDKLRTSLADAAAPAQVDAGYQVTDAAGSNAFTKDADAAAMMTDMVSGQQPTLAGATRVQGQTYTDAAQAKKAEETYNSPVARLDRMGDSAMSIDPATGISLKNAAGTAQKNQIEIDKKMQQEADETYNRVLLERLSGSENWWDGAAEIMSAPPGGIQVPPVKAVVSSDGKTVSMVTTDADGKEKVLKTLPTDPTGQQQFVQQAMRADPVTKLRWLSEQVTREYEQSKQQEKHQLTLAEIRARGDQDRQTASYRAGLEGAGGAGIGKAPSGYRWTSNGEMEYIPGGPADPRTKGMNINDLDKQQKELRTRLEQEFISAGAPAPQMYETVLKRLEDSAANGDSGARAKLTTIRSLQEQIELKGQQILGNATPPSRLSLAGVQAGSLAQPAQQSKGPIKITSQAEHAALPKGTKYIAPNGQTYIKQ